MDPERSKPAQNPTNVVLVTLDCVRPEALSCYQERFPLRKTFGISAQTPNIDSIANDGIRFTNAICQAPFTPASHASILTGLNPYNHGIRHIIGDKLTPDTSTLAEEFLSSGYRTGAFVGAHALDSGYGLDAGFEEYDEDFETTAGNWELGSRRPCEEVVDNALSWLRESDGEQNFLFMHFFDAHDGELPASKDGPMIANLRRILRPIDERIGRPLKVRKGYGHRFHLRQTERIDKEFGRLIEYLEASGTYEDTAIFILSDHGDAFGEHSEFNHREYLYDTTIRIPILYKPPGGQNTDISGGDVSDELARSIDIYPTLLRTLGMDVEDVDGLPLIDDRPDGLTAYAETRFEEPETDSHELRHDYVALRDTRWKLVIDRQSEQRELYDLESDPKERNNRYDVGHPAATRLGNELEKMLSTAGESLEAGMTKAERERVSEHLEGLGYL